MSKKVYSISELETHNTENDCWVAIDGIIYNLTKFLNSHPGGKGVLLSVAGKECTEEFYSLHKRLILEKYGPKLRVGILEGFEDQVDQELPVIDKLTPFAEPGFFKGEWKSPFYNSSHLRFKIAIRQFLNKHVIPDAEQEDEAGNEPSQELLQFMGKNGYWAIRNGVLARPYIKKLNLPLPGNITADELDYFHELIAIQELIKIGFPGYSDGFLVGLIISLPAIIKFCTQEVKDRVVPELLLATKKSCLAITEPYAGSDVANLRATAVDDGKGNFIVNGCKKWITNGYSSDYFVTAVRTGPAGMKGISMLLIPRIEGVSTKKIKTSYSPAAGTALVFFDNVKVPKTNLLGQLNKGFKIIVTNFNHERWIVACGITGACRNILAECFRWSLQRQVFGKRLIEQPVIRQKLAAIAAAVESSEAYLDCLTDQMNKMTEEEAAEKLGGPIALLKYQCTRNATMISDQACQIFGGRAITRTGLGQFVERFQKSFKFSSIYGGSEEILADLAVRQAVGAALKKGQQSKLADLQASRL